MNEKDRTSQIMKRVAQFEYKRSLKRILFFTIIFSVLALFIFKIVLSIYQRLNELETFSLLTLFIQDREVINLFWKETVQTFLSETPLFLVMLGSLLIIVLCFFVIYSKKSVKIAWRRFLSSKYMTKNKLTSNKLLATLLVVGVLIIIVLGLLSNLVFRMQTKTAIYSSANTANQQNETVDEQTDANQAAIEIQPAVSENLTLSITAPQNKAIVANKNLLVSGKTKSKAEVFINDKELRADSSGNFSIVLSLDEGQNIISVSANDDLGNFAAQEIEVFFQPAEN